MPEARDRLLRPGNDADQMLKRLWRSSGSIRIGSDESPVALVLNTASPVVTTRPRAPVRNLYRRYWGNENRAASGRRGRILPCCYPRKPLQDITSLVRAFERKRARLREIGDERLESPLPCGQFVHDSSVPSSSAPLEHSLSLITPKPTLLTRRNPPFLGRVPKILHDITNQEAGETEFLTPENKLLNSIDKVEEAVKEEISRLKRTPAAKKAERKAKVRTLMSMR